ncbi:hypothetical protein [Bacteroides sp. 519]|uniref:hypothetical protein n=1 Tax=Bacteroides sp. 519 TaxID=2302937 RepID=UPI0013D26E9D|nr:hypothetical protein [Bacteroides sp. 519]NDV60591.1 hypothetical protein [Bacteroides sp. 519]
MKQIIPALYVVGASMALIGAAVYITGWPFAPYIYTIGATLFALAQINSPYTGNNKNIKRLRKQQIFGALFLVLAGAFMFFTNKNEWIVILTIGAFLELYTAFRIPQEENKE